jgi:hypothetical protein
MVFFAYNLEKGVGETTIGTEVWTLVENENYATMLMFPVVVIKAG